MFLFL
jgi:hypothetical protein